MYSSYYSDRRFKRAGSLAHELCSKIEVTAATGAIYRSGLSFLPSRRPAIPFSPRLDSLSSSSPARSSSSLIRGEGEARARFAFVSAIYFPFASPGNPPPPGPSAAISLYQPLRSRPRRGGKPSRISSSGDFVDYNKCVCSSRRYKSQSSGPSFISRSFPRHPPLRLLHQRLPIRPFGKTTTTTTTTTIA